MPASAWTTSTACSPGMYCIFEHMPNLQFANVCSCSWCRPVVDTCLGCRIKFEADGVTVSAGSALVQCSAGQYKTNVPCRPSNVDRSVDSTCAGCYPSCRPGDASTLYPGEYISRKCDGSGFEPSVGCTTCTDFCDADDTYIRSEVSASMPFLHCRHQLFHSHPPGAGCLSWLD